MRIALVFSLVLVACSEPASPDAGTDAPGGDAPAPDAPSGACEDDGDCDDGAFCDGEETCDPSDADADDRGCVAGESPCPSGVACDESADACDEDCDGDGDGARATSCGGTDCDDADPERAPGRMEVCDAADRDEDCDATTFGVRDADADGYADAACCNGSTCGTDCDDTSGAVHPSLAEACDGRDNDCDMASDEGVRTTFYLDADGDGFGTGATTMMACTAPAMYVGTGGDCNDATAEVNPSRGEVCGNAIDDNCNGMTDEAGMATFYRDSDGDGRGDPDMPMTVTSACSPPAGFVAITLDCDDADPTIYEGAPELCDRVDNDCSQTGAAEGGTDPSEDVDDDGHAPIGAACTGGPRMRDDCNDMLAATHPGATELCDRIDSDCSLGGLVQTSEDADGDMHAATTAACTGGPYPRDDCRDDVATTYGGAAELCDRVDQDCSSGGGVETAEDADSDGYTPFAAACSGGPFPMTDCDDTSASIRPGAGETCDGVDTDCDGTEDGPPASTASCIGGEVCVAGQCATITGLAAGASHACVVSSRGRVACWGYNASGQLGLPATALTEAGSYTPRRVPGIADATMIAAGAEHTCVVRTGGAVSCWGGNDRGQLGDGTTTNRHAPGAVATITDASAIDAGDRHTCVARTGGGVWCWGRGPQVGHGLTTDRTTPIAVVGLPAMTALEIGAAATHSCAVMADRTVHCWGSDVFGQLGDGSPNDGSVTTSAVAVTGLPAAMAAEVEAFGTSSCVRLMSGAVHCWGSDLNGQLGDGTPLSGRNAPSTAIPSPFTAGQLGGSGGGAHICARGGSPSLACWGWNASGQIGDGAALPAPDRASPTAVASGPTSIIGVAAGAAFTCARSGRAVWCWGESQYGQLGDGLVYTPPSTPRGVPTPVSARF